MLGGWWTICFMKGSVNWKVWRLCSRKRIYKFDPTIEKAPLFTVACLLWLLCQRTGRIVLSKIQNRTGCLEFKKLKILEIGLVVSANDKLLPWYDYILFFCLKYIIHHCTAMQIFGAEFVLIFIGVVYKSVQK